MAVLVKPSLYAGGGTLETFSDDFFFGGGTHAEFIIDNVDVQ